jgi:hypothetical protein
VLLVALRQVVMQHLPYTAAWFHNNRSSSSGSSSSRCWLGSLGVWLVLLLLATVGPV